MVHDRNNLYPLFVLNEAQAYTTETMHRVFIKHRMILRSNEDNVTLNKKHINLHS